MLGESLNVLINGSYHIVKLFFENGKQNININSANMELICGIIQTKIKYILEKAVDKFHHDHDKLQFQVKISVKAKNIEDGTTENVYFTVPSPKIGIINDKVQNNEFNSNTLNENGLVDIGNLNEIGKIFNINFVVFERVGKEHRM